MDFASKRRKLSYNVIANRSLKYVDYSFFFAVAMLLALGLVSMYSASAIYAANKGLGSLFYVKKQALYIVLGFVLMGGAAKADLEKIRKYIKPAVIGTVVLLGVTLLMPPVAHVRRWIPLGFMKLQMSEFAKPVLMLYLADFFDRSASRVHAEWRELLKPCGVALLIFALIAAEPDLGTPALLFGVTMTVFFAAGVKLRYILAPIALMVPVLIEELLRKPYRIARIKNFLSPEQDASGTGYQLMQALLAVGSGGWLGKGLGASNLRLYLPEPHTDFIFPIVAEELGLVGGLAIVGLFTALLVKGSRIARNAPSLYTSLAAFGLTLVIVLQAYFNLSMAIGLIPTKGIPLPFFSYGGSSIWSSMLMVGIILNVSAHRGGR